MRYGAQASSAFEWLALQVGKVPLPVLDTLLPLIQCRALMAAARAGVLEKLSSGPLPTELLAAQTGLDRDCLERVLRVVECMGYLRRKREGWALTATGERYFGHAAPEPHQAFLAYGPAQWRFVEALDQVLRTGEGLDIHTRQSPEEWDAYQRAMLENARSFAPFVVQHTPVPAHASSCLDLAGSHGYLGGALCQRHPGLRSTVLDRPEALATARTLGAGEPWHRELYFREGDLLEDPLGGPYDVVLLSNILHHFSAETNGQILKKVRAALRPGGTVAIFEIESLSAHSPPEAASDAFALFFRITSTSACFSGEDYLRWLREAGFEGLRTVRSIKMPSRMLALARG